MLDMLNERYLRWQMTAKKRQEFYEACELAMESGVSFYQSVEVLYRIASDNGKKPNRAEAVMLKSVGQRIDRGAHLPSDALVDWLPKEELMLIQAAEQGNHFAEGFRHAITLLEAKQKIRGAVAKAVTYPLILLVAVGGLMNLLAVKVVPELEKVVPPAAWQGSASVLRWASHAVHDHGVWIAGLIVSGILMSVLTLGRFKGVMREFVENIPPWSVYRLVHGATFLLSLSVQLRSGVSLHDALMQLSRGTSPWLRERIEAIRYGVEKGSGFGKALAHSGFSFPDKAAIRYVEMVSSFSKFEEALYRFSHRWLSESVQRIEGVGKVLSSVGVVMVGVMIALLFLGMNEIQQAIVK